MVQVRDYERLSARDLDSDLLNLGTYHTAETSGSTAECSE